MSLLFSSHALAAVKGILLSQLGGISNRKNVFMTFS
jgi:hypothetical protein